MHSFNINDIVIYKKDVKYNLYSIKSIFESKCIIQGINYRLIREVEIKDIEKAKKNLIDKNNQDDEKYRDKIVNLLERDKNNYILGKILHIDGDEKYLGRCLELYEKLGVYAYGVKIDEENIYQKIAKYLYEVNPDIIVITGHDYLKGDNIKDLSNYKNTEHFIKAIKEIRKTNQVCCVVAGACQSNFEALIANGADFASSPGRINIHVYDPAIIAVKVATTSFRQMVDMDSIYKYIENGRKAFGGVQTMGKMKIIL